ncbi:hypothetical protein TRICI_000870 [Trichomonascus ciferrii]|uniref:WSC domain-containing protein n=1 Tax=Trichomonascus ciferrii TaxID=44093 RepID=A0A642VA13_9ASCO|nr:hypothetical protein TRICI_000870 [Trichomonascus ciferrii]
MRAGQLILVALAMLTATAQDGGYGEEGCFEDSGSLKKAYTNIYNSAGKCYDACKQKGSAVFAMQGQKCYCGNALPSKTASSSKCKETCPGFPDDTCGGDDSWSVFTIAGKSVSSAAPSSTSSSTTSSKSSSSSSSSSTSSSSSSSSSSSTRSSSTSASRDSSAASATATDDGDKKASGIGGGAIAGIVIGIVAALGLIGAALVFWRKRRNAHNDYNPSTSPDGFRDPFGVHESKLSSASTAVNSQSPPMPVDQRLNPAMLGERRISDGSLADEQDYSRKILRVTNPDNN